MNHLPKRCANNQRPQSQDVSMFVDMLRIKCVIVTFFLTFGSSGLSEDITKLEL